MLKKRTLLVAVVYSIALTVVSLVQINLGDLSDLAPSFSDKIFHFCAYAFLAFLWYKVFVIKTNTNYKQAIGYAVVLAILFGILIEILQENFTHTRVFDRYDILANILGTIFAVTILLIRKVSDVKKY